MGNFKAMSGRLSAEVIWTQELGDRQLSIRMEAS